MERTSLTSASATTSTTFSGRVPRDDDTVATQSPGRTCCACTSSRLPAVATVGSHATTPTRCEG
eukprot:12618536-Prorocentrum_lima.AAC.1